MRVYAFLLNAVMQLLIASVANAALYDASLLTLPEEQGWSYSSHFAGPAPAVTGGSLHLGPTGDTSAWSSSISEIDFSAGSDRLILEASLEIVSSSFTFGFGGTTPRAGFEFTLGDAAGRGVTVYFSDNRIDLMNAGSGPAVATLAFDPRGSERSYRLVVASGVAELFVDETVEALLSGAVGTAGSFSPNTVIFGDGTSAASSESRISSVSVAFIPEPSVALLIGLGLAALAARKGE